MSEGGTIAAGATAFFRSPTHSWVLGTVESLDAKDTYTCKTRADTTQGVEIETVSKLKRDEVFVITNLGLLDENPDDLLMLTLLHDSTLMHALNQRYFRNIIYTNIGPIVVAFNPFNFNIPWYKDDMMVHYTEEDYPIRKNKPHSWAVAHNTYYEMIDHKKNQCVLVSGESGAGKTEAVKIVMKYLSAISVKRSKNEGLRKETELVGKKLLQASPILEGFGNAKTVRNDNSSRFGKFMKVQFKNACLVGAFTIKYLLEKSRIVTAGPGERCYHAFYYICAGKDAGRYKVGNAGTYRSLKAGNCITVDGVDDSADYNECNEAFKDVGINDDEKEEIWKTVGGVLNLLNVEFKAAGGGDSSEVDSKWKESLMTASGLWQIDGEKLGEELIRSVHEARGEKFEKKHTVTAANDTRDSLVKAVYDELFDWLVQKLNKTASVDDFDNFIGLLDIFGFEDFKVNSFEQLCINLANETLQHHYNTYIFNKDIEECRAEGVDVTAIVFPDNTPCLKLITDKMGIIALLDEECALGKGSDEGFLDKVVENCGKHEFFEKDRLAKTSFKVKHYAGDVSYEINGFLDKNRDTLKDDMKRLLRSSSSPFVAGLLPEPVDKTGKKITVGGFFKNQLSELMDLINSTNPHWIRCIKPHPAKKPLMWHGVNVFTQLSSSGIIGTVKVRKAGFPIRMYHGDFLKRFRILKPGPIDDPKGKCEEIVGAMKMDRKRIQTGTTRVFMKNEEYWILENAITSVAGKYVMAMQAYARHMHAKVVLGEKDFEKNKSSILEGVRRTMMLQIEEQRGRRQVEADAGAAFAQAMMPQVEAVEKASRDAIAKQWEDELNARVQKEGAELRRLEQELRERRKRLLQQQEEDRNRMLQREEKGREETISEEEASWQAIVFAATAEQEVRDKCREDEKRGRRAVDEEESSLWVYILEEESASFKFWKEREQSRLASEWKDLIEGVYAVQAERKAAAVAQEKYRYDTRRREMAESRRQQYLAEQIPRNNTDERRAFAKNALTHREQLHSKRESEADQQVDKLRMRKELLMGPEATRQQKIHRIRQEQALVESQRRHAQDGIHDALSHKAFPTDRSPLHTHADPPPQYLFSQTEKSTADTIIAARTPTPGAYSPKYSPKYASPTHGDYGPEMEPLFSPVRTRAAAGMDPEGRAVTPMLPQPNPVSPPKLGAYGV